MTSQQLIYEVFQAVIAALGKSNPILAQFLQLILGFMIPPGTMIGPTMLSVPGTPPGVHPGQVLNDAAALLQAKGIGGPVQQLVTPTTTTPPPVTTTTLPPRPHKP